MAEWAAYFKAEEKAAAADIAAKKATGSAKIGADVNMVVKDAQAKKASDASQAARKAFDEATKIRMESHEGKGSFMKKN